MCSEASCPQRWWSAHDMYKPPSTCHCKPHNSVMFLTPEQLTEGLGGLVKGWRTYLHAGVSRPMVPYGKLVFLALSTGTVPAQ